MKYYCLCVQFDFLSLSGGYSFSSVNKLNVVVLRVIMIQASSHYIGQAQYDLLYLSAK